MNSTQDENLRKKILEEMRVDYDNILSKNFDLAKRFLQITSSGTVDVIFKEQLPVQDKILAYLLGKKYAKESGLAKADTVGNDELKNELGIPEGSLLPGLKILRDKRWIKTIKKDRLTYHYLMPNLVEKVLNELKRKVK